MMAKTDPSAEAQLLYRGRFLQLLQRGHWEFASRTRGLCAVGIIALTPAKELLLVQQHRPPVNAETLELPAGLVGDEDDAGDEEIVAAARRELLEETGYEAADWQLLFGGPSSAGLTDEQTHLVLATNLHKRSSGGGIAGERIIVHAVPLDQLETFLEEQEAAGRQVDLKVRLAALLLQARGLV